MPAKTSGYRDSNAYDAARKLKHFSGAIPLELFRRWKAQLGLRDIKIRERITLLVQRDTDRLERESDTKRRAAE